MHKRTFSSSERYAVWSHHEKRCWLCLEPLRLQETTIDHFLPEFLLNHPDQLARILADRSLPENFDINGFENWLPCHPHCNQKKGATTLRFAPADRLILEKLLKLAPQVRKTATTIGANRDKDKVIGFILSSLEKQTISPGELQAFVGLEQPRPAEMIHLDNGYWLHKSDVARECDCHCERENCLDSTGKIHCYFSRGLSGWVLATGLYWKCYDEIVRCPRCQGYHKRGHIGRAEICDRPYREQARQTDDA